MAAETSIPRTPNSMERDLGALGSHFSTSDQAPSIQSQSQDGTPGRPEADPALMALRSEGIPEIIYPPDSETNRESVPPAVSNAGSDLSSITVLDRGDELFALAYPPGHQPPEVPRPTKSDLEAPLKERLMTLACRPNPKNLKEYFFPRGSIEEIINERVVAEIIRRGRPSLTSKLSDEKIHEYARRVIGLATSSDEQPVSFRKIFAILELMDRGWEVVLFVENRISDADLPLETILNKAENLVYLRHSKDLATPLSFLKHWTCMEHMDFEEWQWKVVVPFFARGPGREHSRFYPLSEKDIMPWTNYEGPIHYGGYSTISRVHIHPCHHKFDNSKVRLYSKVENNNEYLT